MGEKDAWTVLVVELLVTQSGRRSRRGFSSSSSSSSSAFAMNEPSPIEKGNNGCVLSV